MRRAGEIDNVLVTTHEQAVLQTARRLLWAGRGCEGRGPGSLYAPVKESYEHSR